MSKRSDARSRSALPPILPETAHVEKVLEGVEGRADAFAEQVCQPGRVVHRAHVQEGIKLLVREVGHRLEAEREGQAIEAVLIRKLVRMQDLPLEFEEERIPLQGVIEQEGEVVVRARGHLGAAGAAQRHDGEGLVVTKGSVLLAGPCANQAGVDGGSGRGNQAAVVQLRTPDQRIVLRHEPLEGQSRTGLAYRLCHCCFVVEHGAARSGVGGSPVHNGWHLNLPAKRKQGATKRGVCLGMRGWLDARVNSGFSPGGLGRCCAGPERCNLSRRLAS